MKKYENWTRYLYLILVLCWEGTTTTQAQTIVTINYSGISPEEDSPHYGPDLQNSLQNPVQPRKTGSFGIPNPERGFQVRAGYFDIYAQESEEFYENVNGDVNTGLDSLKNYMTKFCHDGITMVELEQYIHFTDQNLLNKHDLPQSQLDDAKELFTENLHDLGLKANFIMNSDYKFLPEAEDPSLRKNLFGVADMGHYRAKGLQHYINEMTDFYNQISPYVAVANLGWIASPYDYNTYRLSGKWMKENGLIWSLFSPYDELVYPASTTNGNFKTNYHNNLVESTQRFDWGVAYKYSNAFNADSAPFAKVRKMVIDEVLEAFPFQKLLTNSLTPWTTYMLTTKNMNNESGGFYGSRKLINKHFLGPYKNTASEGTFYEHDFENLYQDEFFPRIGYYDGAFGGDTYSQAWTIGNGETQEIHWLGGYKASDFIIGSDYGDQACFVDPYLLRQHRSVLWQHADLPVYETADSIISLNRNTPLDTWNKSTFSNHYNRYDNWFSGNTSPYNPLFDYENGEAISSGELQDGFYSALKMRYFNFTSLGIGHNYKLDGRSPYEMPHAYSGGGQTDEGELLPEAIPKKINTTIHNWKIEDHITEQDLIDFGMPVSDRYFENQSGTRSAYEYIRDHLGYRLELQSAQLYSVIINGLVRVRLSVINRGFAAPQNPREIEFCILDTDDNIVWSSAQITGDKDWRFWQPDKFAVSHASNIGSNYHYNTYNYTNNSQYNSYGNDLDSVVIGGIPLGTFNSNWHHSPLNIQYEPFIYSLESAFLPMQYFDENHRLGIRITDPHPDLKENSKYAVKFANMATYIPCNGVTVLMSLGADHPISSTIDSDADGIPNNEENQEDVFNPKNLDVSNMQTDCLNCNHKIRDDIFLQDYNEELEFYNDKIEGYKSGKE